KIIYTTNTIESYHNQLRKVTDRKGAFPNEMALYKLVYLRTLDIKKSWLRPVQNWGQVMNQLEILFSDRIATHLKF
ncbi:transposase, partial [Fusibacter ferrireducens]